MGSRTLLALLSIAGLPLVASSADPTAGAPAPRVTARAHDSHGRPSIWGGVDLALYEVELAHRPSDGVVLQGLELSRSPLTHPEADVQLRLHVECSAVRELTSEDVRARLVKSLQSAAEVRSCQLVHDLTAIEKEMGFSPPVVVLELDLPDVSVTAAVEPDPQEDDQTIIRRAAVSRSARIGGIDIAAMQDRFEVRPQKRGRPVHLGSLRAFVRALEATPQVADVCTLRLQRAGDDPSTRRWSWELEILRESGGR